MAAILCANCRKLISAEELRCPHCGALLPNKMGGTLSAVFRGKLSPIDLIWGLTGLMYLLSVALDLPAALSLENLSGLSGLLSFGSPSSQSLFLLGMTGSVAWSCGHWWTLLTATFLHGGLLHIFFNLYWLRMLGPLALSEFGAARFVLVYLLTGVGGFFASNVLSDLLFHGLGNAALSSGWLSLSMSLHHLAPGNPPTIGASCAVFGLMGALVAYARRRGGTFGDNLSRQVLAWAIIGLLLGVAIPMINNAGHIGGFATGWLLGRWIPLHRRQEGRLVQLLALGLMALTVIGFALSLWQMWEPVSSGTPVCFG